jgi:cystathionine beta-lyase
MPYDFDKVINRRNTDSLKWDYATKRGKPADVLPMWVADMDFPAPPSVIEALRERVDFGVFGYSDTGDDYSASLQSWFARRFNWNIKPEWLVKTPGVVPSLYLAVHAYTNPGDKVLIQSPVYYPFREAIHDTGRTLVTNPLVLCSPPCHPERSGEAAQSKDLSLTDGNHYEIDFEDLEAKLSDPQVKLFILCSPHNPVARVWTREELTRMGELCINYNVIVVSDEIHMDFIYPGNTHTVFADISEAFADISITATAPSKTFNVAGLQLSNVFIPNERLRRQYLRAFSAAGLSQPSYLGFVACKAAYDGGEAWLEDLLVYLKANFDYLRDYLAEHIPAIKLVEPEGTYLAWLDCRELGLDHKQLEDFIINDAKLWLDGGTMFGPEGEGFQRMNLACPRATLTDALERLAQAYYELNN